MQTGMMKLMDLRASRGRTRLWKANCLSHRGLIGDLGRVESDDLIYEVGKRVGTKPPRATRRQKA